MKMAPASLQRTKTRTVGTEAPRKRTIHPRPRILLAGAGQVPEKMVSQEEEGAGAGALLGPMWPSQ